MKLIKIKYNFRLKSKTCNKNQKIMKNKLNSLKAIHLKSRICLKQKYYILIII